jgi:hypothetical protein
VDSNYGLSVGCYRWSRDKSLTYRDMEDFFSLLLSAVADLLFEVFFQVVAEEVVALMVRFIRNAFQETRPITRSWPPSVIYCWAALSGS